MAEKKTIFEQALQDIDNVKKALNANTKEILRGVAREEIDSVVKESLIKEDDYEEEDLDTTDDSVELGMDADASTDDVTGDLGDEDSYEDDALSGFENSDEVDSEMDSDFGMDSDELGDELDMTGASDDDVIAIYKKLSGEDEIEIVGDEIHLNISEPGQYVVKTTGGVPNETNSESLDNLGGDDEDLDDETEYEIEMDDDDETEENPFASDDESEEEDETEETQDDESSESEDEEEEEELTEQIPVGSAQAHRLQAKQSNPPLGAGADNLKETVLKSKQLVLETTQKYNALLNESAKLKSQNEDFRKALQHFKGQLLETAVFNSNLTYVTRLFMEHSTTKKEKENIIKRFDDEVRNLTESKQLHAKLDSELKNRKPINESIEKNVITTSTSTKLNENVAYVDPQSARIKELIEKTK